MYIPCIRELKCNMIGIWSKVVQTCGKSIARGNSLCHSNETKHRSSLAIVGLSLKFVYVYSLLMRLISMSALQLTKLLKIFEAWILLDLSLWHEINLVALKSPISTQGSWCSYLKVESFAKNLLHSVWSCGP